MAELDDLGRSDLNIRRQIQQVSSTCKSKVFGLRHIPSRVRKARKTLRDYGYESLENASDQIRLLKFRSRGIREPITVDISTWSRSEAPPYYAISYTWGTKRMRKMFVNGCPIDVRQNCFYALWQAQLRHRNDYIWIDCLCIDQGNDQEKSEQVAMMYEIYKAAARVLVCIGPGGGDSDYLMALGGLVTRFRSPAHRTRNSRFRREMESKTLSQSLDGILDQYNDVHILHRTICAVSKLGYWKRLWVMQEMIASDEQFEILYGSKVISYSALATLVRHSRACKRCSEELNFDFYVLIEHSLHRVTRAAECSVHRAICSFWRLECADPRDYIYGTFNFLNTWQDGWEQMRPDYTKPLWDLVLEVAPHVGIERFKYMIAAFGTDCYDANIKGVLSKQRVPTEAFQLDEIPLARVCPWKPGLREVCRIARDPVTNTRLTADLLLGLLEEKNATEIETLFSQLGTGCGINLPQPHLRAIWSRNHLAALVSAEAQEGDILVRILGEPGIKGFLLVLRLVRNDEFAIVGQGIIVNGICLKPDYMEPEGVMTLHLTPEEAVALVAQDLKVEAFRTRNYKECTDETAMLLRVVTQPKLSPGIGATIEWYCKVRRASFTGETFEELCDCDWCRREREKARAYQDDSVQGRRGDVHSIAKEQRAQIVGQALEHRTPTPDLFSTNFNFSPEDPHHLVTRRT